MKREHHHLLPNLNPNPNPGVLVGGGSDSSSISTTTYSMTTTSAKSKQLWEEQDQDGSGSGGVCGGMDELLAVVGYKVRSSDMADVAHKIEQLEQAMTNVEDTNIPSSDTLIHYNPSDISTWLESMLSGLSQDNINNNISNNNDNNNSSITSSSSSLSDYDLKAIPGKAIYNNSSNCNPNFSSSSPTNKRIKVSPCDSSESRPLVLVDSQQENGVRLVHTLLACAEAVSHNNLSLAEALLHRIGFLALSQPGAMRKVATYFAEALARRIYGLYPETPLPMVNNHHNNHHQHHHLHQHRLSDMLQIHFYETCPYLKFAHFTANQAILEAFQGKSRVHVIDFSMNQGMQWPALMQALALRPGGPPAFRLTGIGPPAIDNSDHLQEVGWKLAQLADTIHVDFEFRGFVANSLADLEASMLDLRPSENEFVAVNSVFEFHKLLARPGAVEKVLSVVKQIKPEIVTVVEQEANHNGAGFLDRFTESLHYYSTMFDSLEGSTTAETEEKVMAEMYLGKQICNVVACEGVDRVERHETLNQWRSRFGSTGFEPVHLGSNAYKQASMLLALFAGGDGYRVEENNGCLMLGWHTRPLIATSAWRLGGVTQ